MVTRVIVVTVVDFFNESDTILAGCPRISTMNEFVIAVVCRFGQKFVDRVANPKDLILFHRRKMQQASDQKSNNPGVNL